MPERLTRDMEHAMLGGVCAGFARRYGLDATLVRVVYLLAIIVSGGVAIPLYLAAWIVMPREAPTLVPRATAPDQPTDATERVTDEVRRVGDRVTQAARVVAGKTREAAEEVADIARRPRDTPGGAPGGGSGSGGRRHAPPSPPWPPLAQDPEIYRHGQPQSRGGSQ